MAGAAEARIAVAAAPTAERTARLVDGREVVVRRAVAGDLSRIVDFFDRLSAASRYSRFLSPQPRLRAAMIERLVAPGPDRVTVVAQPVELRATTRHVVAVGGWAYVPARERCDVSVAVADAWQNVMLGTCVVLVLLRDAVACGHRRFAAEALSGNARMLGLLHALGAPLRTRHEAGVASVEFEVPGEVP